MGTLPCTSPRGQDQVFANSVFAVTLQNVTIVTSKNQLYLEVKIRN